MAMRGIIFNNLPPVSPPVTARMDVSCFIGFVPLQKDPLFSETLKQWLREYGWDKERIDKLSENPESILNTPIPLESWEAFQAVFDEKRLDRLGTLRSRPISEPLTLAESDTQLYVIVDRHHITVTLEPHANHQLDFEELVEQINAQLLQNGASTFIETVEQGGQKIYRLIIQRTDDVTAGEITVYSNESLGFPEALQDDASYVQNYSAAAIKAFFRQGGKKCYFISMGNPLEYNADDAEKARQLYKLLWGKKKAEAFLKNYQYSRNDFISISLPDIPNGAYPLEEWNGMSHLVALSDVTYLCFPDLVDILGTPGIEVPKAPETPEEEIFVVCSQTMKIPSWSYTNALSIPECGQNDFKIWKRIIEVILDYLSANVRTVQLVASLPLPEKRVRQNFAQFILNEILPGTNREESKYRRLQLVFPWLKTQQSDSLPESLEPPEGALVGLLAQNALRVGAFRSIAGSFIDDVYDLAPQDIDAYSQSEASEMSFADRVCWFDFIPDGIALHSDVTAVFRETHRYGAVRRIMILVQRAAHQVGLNHVFEPSSERIWLTIKDNLTDLLQNIYQNNGMRGKSSVEAYSVDCGRSTMTQNDIDNGRLIASITLQPAVPIERIAVDLLLERDGSVTLWSNIQ